MLHAAMIQVFIGPGLSEQIKLVSTLTWGMPLAIALVACLADPSHFTTEHVCWLDPRSSLFEWAFLVPMVLVVSSNFILLGTVLLTLLRTGAPWKQLFSALCSFTVLLGLSWALGIPVYLDGGLVWQIIFTVGLSTQGVSADASFVLMRY